jgi:hypothetical protein
MGRRRDMGSEALEKCYNVHHGLLRRLRVVVVVDNNSTRDLRQKPYQIANFGEGIGHKTPYRCPHRLNLSSQSSRSCALPNIKVLKDKDLEFANSIRPFLRQTGDPCHKAGLRVEQPIARICVRLTPLPQVFRPSASFTGHEYLDCLSGTSGSCGMLTGAGVYNSAS